MRECAAPAGSVRVRDAARVPHPPLPGINYTHVVGSSVFKARSAPAMRACVHSNLRVTSGLRETVHDVDVRQHLPVTLPRQLMQHVAGCMNKNRGKMADLK